MNLQSVMMNSSYATSTMLQHHHLLHGHLLPLVTYDARLLRSPLLPLKPRHKVPSLTSHYEVPPPHAVQRGPFASPSCRVGPLSPPTLL